MLAPMEKKRMKRKIINIGLILSLALNLTILGFFGKTIYLESRKIGNHIITDYKIKNVTSAIQYYNGLKFNINGKFNIEDNFSRLPSKYETVVRPAVWNLSKNSSGISIRFKTNSPDISVKWELSNYREHSNMSRICASGLDLYCLVGEKWQYVRSGIPTDFKTEQLLISEMDTTTKEFILNLPLYDGIENIEIGIVKGFEISKSEDDYKIKRPIVFYGTSITQGGSASRPGLAYPSIISRDLNVETINLGFSGNGKFEKSVGLALCEIDAEIYVIDCVPNSSPEVIKKNAYNLIKQIRKARPKTPILLVESIIREYSYFQKTDETIFGGLKYIQSQNNELKNAYNKLIEEGIENVFYLSSEGLIGFDHEGTIDGTHLNDLGMTRIANKIGNKINEILEVKETTGANN
jgi:lysophospholipase L1-like esterase